MERKNDLPSFKRLSFHSAANIEDYLREKGLWEGYVTNRELLVRYLRNILEIR